MNQTIFQFTGGRELVKTNRADEIIGDFEKQIQEYTKHQTSLETTNNLPIAIKLGNKSYDYESAQKVATYLYESIHSKRNLLHQVAIADLSDMIAGRPEEEALKILQLICESLQELELIELNLSDNALGLKGVEACRSLLTKKTLKKLYLCNDGLSAEAMVGIESILHEGGSPPLDTLHIYNNMCGNDGGIAMGKIISQSVHLENIRFSATRCGSIGCHALAQALCVVDQIQMIDFSDNSFGNEATSLLVNGLCHQKIITSLNLRDDGLGDEGIMQIIACLSTPTFLNLSFLDLSGNEITSDMITSLTSSIASLKQLKSLYLDDNELGSVGCKKMYQVIVQLKCLQTLSCCDCEITASGAIFLAKSVAKLSTFVNLELNGNQICEHRLEEIQMILNEAGKILGKLDENDEDGEDDAEDGLEEWEATSLVETIGQGKKDNEEDDDLIDAFKSATIN